MPGEDCNTNHTRPDARTTSGAITKLTPGQRPRVVPRRNGVRRITTQHAVKNSRPGRPRFFWLFRWKPGPRARKSSIDSVGEVYRDGQPSGCTSRPTKLAGPRTGI